jgi:site-specific recombinase XerC
VSATAVIDLDRLTPEQLSALLPAIRDAMRDKSYELLPLGEDVAAYLRARKAHLTEATYVNYESTLRMLARDYGDLRVEDFEPPVGTERLEAFLADRWGNLEAATYNKNLSFLGEFFKFYRRRFPDRLSGDPTLLIEKAKSRQTHRTVFSDDERRAIIADQDDRRDRICCRLILDYGLRKGALRAVQISHFDHQRKRLTIFTKGKKVQVVPIPAAGFWQELELYMLEAGSQPGDYLLCGQRTVGRGAGREQRRFPKRQMGQNGAHKWWYRCLANAGIVPEGVESGERMHKGRHTAGQRVLDKTDGNLKAVQKLLGHASIATTGDIYTDWDIDSLARTLAEVLGDEG